MYDGSNTCCPSTSFVGAVVVFEDDSSLAMTHARSMVAIPTGTRDSIKPRTAAIAIRAVRPRTTGTAVSIPATRVAARSVAARGHSEHRVRVLSSPMTRSFDVCVGRGRDMTFRRRPTVALVIGDGTLLRDNMALYRVASGKILAAVWTRMGLFYARDMCRLMTLEIYRATSGSEVSPIEIWLTMRSSKVHSAIVT